MQLRAITDRAVTNRQNDAIIWATMYNWAKSKSCEPPVQLAMPKVRETLTLILLLEYEIIEFYVVMVVNTLILWQLELMRQINAIPIL